MSGLRIRSEAVPDAVWPQAFLPPQADPDAAPADTADFAPLLAAVARALTALFGMAVTVMPGQPGATDGDAPAVAPALAGLLATLRLGGRAGGDPPVGVSGVALARHAVAIGAAIDAAAAQAWPPGCALPGFDIAVACGAVAGAVHVVAPAIVAPAPVVRAPAAPVGLFDVAVRVRVEIASDMAPVSGLLPLVAGLVLPISPVAEMPLIVGDHRIGRATVAALPDGRQAATVVAMAVEPLGGRR